jgi:hypothetical protein
MSSDDDHKLILTTYDKPTFKKIVEREYGQRIHSAFNVNRNCLDKDKVKEVRSQLLSGEEVSDSILGAYNHFYEKIRNHIKIDTQKVSGLLFTITSNFKLIHLSLVGTEDAEKVFESINATGRMLSNFDYLRNNLFLRARKLGKDPESEKFYRDIYYGDKAYWPFEGWKGGELESFLEAFIEVTRPPECLKKGNAKPFEEYLEYSKHLEKKYPQDKDKIPYEFKQLSQWAESYQNLQNKQEFKDYKKFCDDLSLRDLDSFLLFVEHTNSGQLSNATKILDSYIIRSLLVLEDTTRSHADIKESCFETIESCFSKAVGGIFCINSFVNCLLSSNPGIDIDNEAVFYAFWQTTLGNKNAAFIAYVFNRIIQEYPETPLRNFTWGMHKHLITNIEELLLSDPDPRNELTNDFNEVWPELRRR